MRRRFVVFFAVFAALLVGVSGTAAYAASTKITKQPVGKVVASGHKVSFAVRASGPGLHYQWQRKAPGGSWVPLAGTTARHATLTLVTRASENGWGIRAVVKGSSGSAVSKAVKLTVVTKPKVTRNPASRTVYTGATVSFAVAAKGGALSYSWSYLKPGGRWTALTTKSAHTARLTVAASLSKSGYTFRVRVANKAGRVYSRSAKLTVRKPTGVPGNGSYNCPAGYPVKGNADSGIYHLPGDRFYKVTIPEECFVNGSAAAAAGYRHAKV